MKTQHIVYIGDAAQTLKEQGDFLREHCSPQLIMTSPPYAQGKEYEQGLDYDRLWRLVGRTARAVAEVSRPGAFFCVNFGETTKYDKQGKLEAPDGSIDRTISHLYTVAMKRAGWRIHSRRVWKKCFPRIRAAPYNHTMRIPVAEFENVWTWRLPGGDRETKPENHEHMRAVWDTGDKWHEHAGKGEYPTPYPLILPRLAIRIWARPGDWVLDPFAGSCTTALAAGLDGCNSVSFELFKDYRPVLEKKLRRLTELGHDIFVNETRTARGLPTE